MHLKSGSQNANVIIVHNVTTSKVSHSHNINVTDLMKKTKPVISPFLKNGEWRGWKWRWSCNRSASSPAIKGNEYTMSNTDHQGIAVKIHHLEIWK